MKKNYIVVIALASLAFAACQKQEDTSIDSKPLAVRATVSVEDETKTNLDPDALTLTWTLGDKIYIKSDANASLWKMNEFSIDNAGDISADGKTATFTDHSGKTWTDAVRYVAHYGKGWSIGGSGWGLFTYSHFTFPASQEYYENGEGKSAPNPDYLYMTAWGTDPSNFVFYHRSAILKIPVKDTNASPTTLSSIKVEAPGIGGRYYTAWIDSGQSEMSELGMGRFMRANSAGETTLTNINVPLSGTARNFYIIVAPYSDGVGSSVTFTLKNTGGDTKTFTYTVTSGNITFGQGKVTTFPALDWNSKAL